MKPANVLMVLLLMIASLSWSANADAQQASPKRILIHMKTSLALDDAQVCAVPNLAWAAVKAGNKVTILVDASAVTSVTKGYRWFNRIFWAGSTLWIERGYPNASVKHCRSRWAYRWERSRTTMGNILSSFGN